MSARRWDVAPINLLCLLLAAFLADKGQVFAASAGFIKHKRRVCVLHCFL